MRFKDLSNDDYFVLASAEAKGQATLLQKRNNTEGFVVRARGTMLVCTTEPRHVPLDAEVIYLEIAWQAGTVRQRAPLGTAQSSLAV